MTHSERKIISKIENTFIPQNPQEWNLLGEDFEAPKNIDLNAELDFYTLNVIHAYQILEYTVTQLLETGDIVFLTAFGAEGCVLFKILADLRDSGKISKNRFVADISELNRSSQIGNRGRIAIANLDTGYQFKETLALKSRLEEEYQLNILMVQAALSVQEQDAKYGKDLYKVDPDQCCYMRKLVPLANLLQGKYAWITSIRREQTEYRASALAFEYDSKFKLGKINPLIHWTKSNIWKFIHEHKVPYNPLFDEGYDSIGCEPCTSPGDGRKGRWAGKDKIECGLHIQDSEMKQGGEFTI